MHSLSIWHQASGNTVTTWVSKHGYVVQCLRHSWYINLTQTRVQSNPLHAVSPCMASPSLVLMHVDVATWIFQPLSKISTAAYRTEWCFNLHLTVHVYVVSHNLCMRACDAFDKYMPPPFIPKFRTMRDYVFVSYELLVSWVRRPCLKQIPSQWWLQQAL